MDSYNNYNTWKKIQKYLPSNNRLYEGVYPIEYYWKYNDFKIHIDHYQNPKSKVKFILLHGIGGNGRLLSFIKV